MADTNSSQPSTATTPTKVYKNISFRQISLNKAADDKSHPIHQSFKQDVVFEEFFAAIQIVNHDHVFATAAAREVIKASDITTGFILRKYVANYKKSILSRPTKGKHKGKLMLNPSANAYVHTEDVDAAICIEGSLADIDGAKVREVYIYLQSEAPQETPADVQH